MSAYSEIEAHTTHLFGPERMPEEGCLVLCLVRDGAPWLATFIDHYLRLGVSHIVFLDNGSTDNTLALAQTYSQVSVFQCPLPVATRWTAYKQYLIHRFALNRWALVVDIDELFDYPYSNLLSLHQLLRYLDQNRHTAMVCQLLDMIADCPINELPKSLSAPLQSLFPYYDLSFIYQGIYPTHGAVITNPDIQLCRCGVRFQQLGASVCLTKAPLVKLPDAQGWLNCHYPCQGQLADISGVLLHYRFWGDFANRTGRLILEGDESAYYRENQQYFTVLTVTPDLNLKQPTAQRLGSVNELVESGFLKVSEPYTQFVQTHGQPITVTKSQFQA